MEKILEDFDKEFPNLWGYRFTGTLTKGDLVESKNKEVKGFIRNLLVEYKQALIWCSGSEDFQLEGKAREGWEKIVIPLLK